MILLVAAVAGLLLGILVALIHTRFEHMKRDPRTRTMLSLIWLALRRRDRAIS